MDALNGTVKVGTDVLENLGVLLLVQYEEAFILVDSNTRAFCLPLLQTYLPETLATTVLEIPAGEASKTLNRAAELWEKLNACGATRNAVLINLGGGMITDIGGFVASTYKRGIDFINLPTSLLGMIDAAIGGKTGIDLNNAKNLIGTFQPAYLTLINPAFLQTLPKRELRSGFAEALKHGLIQGRTHLEDVLTCWFSDDLTTLIRTSVKVKLDIVEQDFDEGNLRKVLNFGHTLGHAVESYFLDKGAPVLHGEAVAAGMLMEAWLSTQKCGLPWSDYELLAAIIRTEFPDLIWPEKDDIGILYWLRFDKKNTGEVQQYALLEQIGHCTYGHAVTIEESAAALAHYRNLVAGE